MLRTRGRYKTYSVQTKLLVINSQNPSLYLNEGVPRTTAIYWLKNAKRLKEEEYQPNKLYESKIKLLEEQLENEKSLKDLIIKVRTLHPYSFSKKKVNSKTIKKKIIEVIKEVTKKVSLKVCLKNIGLSPTTYYRWLTIFTRCEFSNNTCKRRLPNQLTYEEISKMKYFVTAEKYAHIPINSLCLLAQRLGEVFCSVHTWYKYNNLFEWRRFQNKKYAKNNRKGIKATRPNEYWHIDVSHIVFPGQKKVYFQAVIDNFSRYILSWNLTDEISHFHTIKLLEEAKKNSLTNLEDDSKLSVVTDGGSENTAKNVTQFFHISKNLQRLIARVDLEYSNSMIEAFFKSLKNNFLYFQKIRTEKDIKRKIRFYVQQHNEFIPKSILGGATPKEAYINSWNEKNVEKLNHGKAIALQSRKGRAKAIVCRVCS